MKRNPICSLLLILPFLNLNCKTYKPIEKATIPLESNLSKNENMTRQLGILKEGDLISVKLTNESSYDLIYNSVSRDTLIANLQKPKTSVSMKIPIERVKEVKVEKINLPLTLIISTILIGGSFLFVTSNLDISGTSL